MSMYVAQFLPVARYRYAGGEQPSDQGKKKVHHGVDSFQLVEAV